MTNPTQPSDPIRPAEPARGHPTRESASGEFRWWVAVTVCVVACCLLWGHTTSQHKDALDTGWKSATILASAATLISVGSFRLAQREHHRQIQRDRLNRVDAIARQITDLSAKSGEQLGRDEAVGVGQGGMPVGADERPRRPPLLSRR